ncbi:MAG: NMD3-related protein [Candidatus Methanoperedens sp.]|nr:NMD3-related protein [Candidatus Methanoperedens sp.]
MTDNEEQSIRNIIDKYIGNADYEFLDAKMGMDVYVTGLNSAKHIANKIIKVLGGSIKQSSKYQRVQGGRVIYRFTIRVKLPDEASGARYGISE